MKVCVNVWLHNHAECCLFIREVDIARLRRRGKGGLQVPELGPLAVLMVVAAVVTIVIILVEAMMIPMVMITFAVVVVVIVVIDCCHCCCYCYCRWNREIEAQRTLIELIHQ